jgi:hypothetical protein
MKLLHLEQYVVTPKGGAGVGLSISHCITLCAGFKDETPF